VARWHGVPVTGAPDADAWPELGDSTRRAIPSARATASPWSTDRRRFVDDFFRLHLGVRKRSTDSLRTAAFFASMQARFGARGEWHALAAERDGELLAVTVYLRHRDTLFYKFNASDPAVSAPAPTTCCFLERHRARRVGSAARCSTSRPRRPRLNRYQRGLSVGGAESSQR